MDNLRERSTLRNNSMASRPKPNIGTDKKSNKKSSKKGNFLVVLVALLLVAIISAGCVYFNVGGIKTLFFKPSATQNQEQTTDVQDQQKSELQTMQDELDKRKSEVDTKSLELDQRAKDLDTREQNILQRETDVTTKEAEFAAKQQEAQSVVKLYENMEPGNAASVLLQYQNKTDVANILVNMSSAKVSAILSAMPAADAAGILKLIQAGN